MCDWKPGPRCASDTRAGAVATLERYQEAHPQGPPVDPLSAASGIFHPAAAASTAGDLTWVNEGREGLTEGEASIYAQMDAYEASGQYDEDEQFRLANAARSRGLPTRRKSAEVDGVKVVAHARHHEDEGLVTAEHRLEFPSYPDRGSVYYGDATGKWVSFGPGGMQTAGTREEAIKAQVLYWKSAQRWPHVHDQPFDAGEDVDTNVDSMHLPNRHTHPGRWWVRPPAELSKYPNRRFVTTPEATTWAVDLERPGHAKVWRRDEAGNVIDASSELSGQEVSRIQSAAASDPGLNSR